WVDQLCINQEYVSERTQQVQLMRAICQQAQNTVTWLGPNDGNAGTVLQLVSDIYRISLHKEVKMQSENERALAEANPSITGNYTDLPPKDDKKWAGFSQFPALPWFERC
ncbi:hypothetical protein K469DRAFT_577747, partial [Zopfia rhizophila CBS 207.26]